MTVVKKLFLNKEQCDVLQTALSIAIVQFNGVKNEMKNVMIANKLDIPDMFFNKVDGDIVIALKLYKDIVGEDFKEESMVKNKGK